MAMLMAEMEIEMEGKMEEEMEMEDVMEGELDEEPLKGPEGTMTETTVCSLWSLWRLASSNVR